MNRLKELRINLGMTQKDFAKSLGLGAATYNGYENGIRDPRSDFWTTVAQRYGVSTDFLLGLDHLSPVGKTPTIEAQRVGERYDRLDDIGQGAVLAILQYEEERLAAERPTHKQDQIRLYLVPPAAGYAQPIEDEDYEWIDRPQDAPKDADFCLHISGDSMEPYLKDGELVYVKRDVPLQQFDVGIFFFGGDVYIKQYSADNLGNIYLLSANPKRKDANVTIMHGDTRAFVCFGKVLLPKKLPEPTYQ